MKTIIKIFVALIALVLMYLVATDGMISHFGLSQSIQFTFNFGAVVIAIPTCVILLFSDIEKFCFE